MTDIYFHAFLNSNFFSFLSLHKKMGKIFSSPIPRRGNNLQYKVQNLEEQIHVLEKMLKEHNNLENLHEETIKNLRKENSQIRGSLEFRETVEYKKELRKQYRLDKVDDFVDKWFENNKEVDIGVVDLPIVGEIDLLPDSIEKHLYKKALNILISFKEECFDM